MSQISDKAEDGDAPKFTLNDFGSDNSQIPSELFSPGHSEFSNPIQPDQNFVQDEEINFSFEKDKDEIIDENEDDAKNKVSQILDESYLDYLDKIYPKDSFDFFYDKDLPDNAFKEKTQKNILNNDEFLSIFRNLDRDDDTPEHLNKNLIFIKNKIIPNEKKPEEKQEENNFEQYQNHETQNNNLIKNERP